jgi:uncharacterized membrane protein YgdD (TMEM256/DUF423 family)
MERDMETKKARLWGAAGALSAFTGVALGAFGAHGLKSHLSPEMMGIFETGVRYQMYHAGGMILAAIAAGSQYAAGRWMTRACWGFAGGSLFFSGSLYALALTDIRWFGAVTPIGGILFLVGWALFAAGLLRTRPG